MTIPGDSHLEIHASCATYVLTEVGGIALALCCSGRSEPANSGVLGRWRELNLICHWEDHLSRLCDTTWSYWLRDLLPTLLSDLQRVPSLPPLFSAFAQPLQRLPIGRARQEFLKELRQALEDGIIQPICAKLEEDLRLLVHATMQVTRQSLPLSPPEDGIGVSSLTTFATHWIRCRGHQRSGGQMLGHRCAKCKVLVLLSNPSVTICYEKPALPHPIPKQHIQWNRWAMLPWLPCGLDVSFCWEVELRLSRHFYDLAALAPQDAEAYVRMQRTGSAVRAESDLGLSRKDQKQLIRHLLQWWEYTLRSVPWVLKIHLNLCSVLPSLSLLEIWVCGLPWFARPLTVTDFTWLMEVFQQVLWRRA